MSHVFCRELLKDIMVKVKEKVSKKDIKYSWAFKNSCGFEFQGPGDYYVFLGTKVDCLTSAKAEGWSRYLEYLGNTPCVCCHETKASNHFSTEHKHIVCVECSSLF